MPIVRNIDTAFRAAWLGDTSREQAAKQGLTNWVPQKDKRMVYGTRRSTVEESWGFLMEMTIDTRQIKRWTLRDVSSLYIYDQAII